MHGLLSQQRCEKDPRRMAADTAFTDSIIHIYDVDLLASPFKWGGDKSPLACLSVSGMLYMLLILAFLYTSP